MEINEIVSYGNSCVVGYSEEELLERFAFFWIGCFYRFIVLFGSGSKRLSRGGVCFVCRYPERQLY
jgi:hypothetical protein